MKIFKEFKDFINKGNVVDMAVGVVIATAFGKITSSLVADIIMPLIGLLTGNQSLSELSHPLAYGIDPETGEEIVTNALRYGQFIQFVIDFLIIALAVFVFVKVIEKMKNLRIKNEEEIPAEEAPAPEPEPTKEEVLLTEIRDILKNK